MKQRKILCILKQKLWKKKNCTVAILLHESKSVQVPMRTLVQ